MYRNKLTRWCLLVVFITIAVGLIYNVQYAQFISSVKAASQALPSGDLSVVGKPTLPAATVDAILKDLGSPMSGTGQVVEQASQKTNIDDAFALAVWWTETNDGAAGVGLADQNPGSVRGSVGYPSAYDGYTIYPSFSAAIVYWFHMLKNMYVNQGLSTVYLISHPYVGTSSSPLWAGKVVALMLKYRGEAPPAPIVVPHGKRVIEPSIYVSVTPIPVVQKRQVQIRVNKTLKNNTSSIIQQGNTSPKTSTTTYAIVFFTLLLALAIVACVLWLEKRSGYNMVGVQAHDEIIRVEGEQDKKSHGWVVQGELVQGGGKPRPYYIRNARPFRSIALYALQDANAPNMDTLISTIQEVDVVKTDALMLLAQEMGTDENFRIRSKIFLPSTSRTDPAKSEESSATSNLRGRSTGLLSRYGEIHQG
ncbi:MAG TPA: hypothetical protein VNW73_07260 [Ktedonobacteraceae bacterium]|nr:hypothetical protein [Ktedonobacteraceae bacterium]